MFLFLLWVMTMSFRRRPRTVDEAGSGLIIVTIGLFFLSVIIVFSAMSAQSFSMSRNTAQASTQAAAKEAVVLSTATVNGRLGIDCEAATEASRIAVDVRRSTILASGGGYALDKNTEPTITVECLDVFVEELPSFVRCPDGWRINAPAGTCSRTTQVVVYGCSDGSIAVGNPGRCGRSQQTGWYCLNGTQPTTSPSAGLNCGRTLTSYSCPSGGQNGGTATCTVITTTYPDGYWVFSCPSGQTRGGAIGRNASACFVQRRGQWVRVGDAARVWRRGPARSTVSTYPATEVFTSIPAEPRFETVWRNADTARPEDRTETRGVITGGGERITLYSGIKLTVQEEAFILPGSGRSLLLTVTSTEKLTRG